MFHHEKYSQRFLNGELSKTPHLRAAVTSLLGPTGLDELTNIKTRPAIKGVVDGPIDCDKLDYLRRDGISCGVPYAQAIDQQRLLSSICSVRNKRGDLQLCLTPKGVAPAESMINARYHLFSEVYWHKTSRSIASVVKNAMYRCLLAGNVSQSALDQAVIYKGDWEFLAWLHERLSRVNSVVADALILDPLLSGNRRKLYKRVSTITEMWDSGKPDSAYDKISERRSLDYSEVVRIQEWISTHLNDYGPRVTSHWQNLLAHEVLLDIPPANKDLLYMPQVYYENDVNGEYFYDFKRVSGAFRFTERLLKTTQKIRLFAHPDKVDQIRSLPNHDKVVRNAIMSALG